MRKDGRLQCGSPDEAGLRRRGRPPGGGGAEPRGLPPGAGDVQASGLSDRSGVLEAQPDASEPGGYFRSADITNLTSNELWFQHVIPDSVARVKPGGVYLGVGPEQNFTYMAALRPKMAIIFDIRRGNIDCS